MDKILLKCLSGRFILTVIAGLVFAYCSVTKNLTSESVGIIITAVFMSYFQRTDRNGQSTKQP